MIAAGRFSRPLPGLQTLRAGAICSAAESPTALPRSRRSSMSGNQSERRRTAALGGGLQRTPAAARQELRTRQARPPPAREPRRPSPAGLAVRARLRAPPPGVPQHHRAAPGPPPLSRRNLARSPQLSRESGSAAAQSGGSPRPAAPPSAYRRGRPRGGGRIGTRGKVCGRARRARRGLSRAALRAAAGREM